MTKKIWINNLLFLLPFLMLVFLILLSRTSYLQKAPAELSIGILLDLIITIPFVYFLLIRKTKLPNFTVIYPFLIGLVVAGYILPAEHQRLLTSIKYIAIPLLEFGVISTIVYKMISLRKSLKNTKGTDFYDRLLIACQDVFPNRIGKLLATEIAVIFYFFGWSSKQSKSPLEFTGYLKSGIRTTIGVLLFLVVAETAVVHLLVAQWSEKVAWVLTILGAYTIIQVVAVLRSLSQRLITIDSENKNLVLKYGFGTHTLIPISEIETIKKTRRLVTDDKNHCSLSLFEMLDTHNVIIKLRNDNTLFKIYGMEKKYTSIAFFVDEVDLFMEAVLKMEPEINGSIVE